MTDVNDLERRIKVIEETEAIKRLKYRYWRYLDLKQWDDLATLFVADASVSYGAGAVTIHQGHQPEIDLTSAATATGTWALYNYMYNEKQNRGIRIGAYYYDDYVKVGSEWKFQRIGYAPIFHEEWKRDDLPSLHLIAGGQ